MIKEMPRERMLQFGPEALSVKELIAILLGTGTSGKNVVVFAEELLDRFGGMRELFEASLQELMAVRGIGMAKAVQLKAAFSLALRLLKTKSDEKKKIENAKDAFSTFSNYFFFHDREEMVVLSRDTKGKQISLAPVTKGILNEVSFHPREVLREVMRHQAFSFILAHNHPSGDPTPSRADREVTNAMAKAAQLMGIRLDDHIIVGDNRYYSFFEKGELFTRNNY